MLDYEDGSVLASLSVVVPYLGDEASFEATLISVLENRPPDCEVLVPHDGSYRDPFDLSDEVRFIVHEETGRRATAVRLVLAAVRHVSSDIVLVLGGGLQLTADSFEPALDQFTDEDCAAVAPVIRSTNSDARILAAGWCTSPLSSGGRLAAGQASLTSADLAALHAPMLLASYWDSDVLEAILEQTVDCPPAVAEFIAGYVLRATEYRCCVAPQSTLHAAENTSVWPSQFSTGRISQAVRSAARNATLAGRIGDCMLGCLASLPHPTRWLHGGGRCLAVTQTRQVLVAKQRIESAIREVERLDEDADVFALPETQSPLRRAA